VVLLRKHSSLPRENHYFLLGPQREKCSGGLIFGLGRARSARRLMV